LEYLLKHKYIVEEIDYVKKVNQTMDDVIKFDVKSYKPGWDLDQAIMLLLPMIGKNILVHRGERYFSPLIWKF